MKRMGVNKFRMSIAWPRIVPGGTASSPVNAEGVAFYHKVIDALLEAGIEPWVTTYHWVRKEGRGFSFFFFRGSRRRGGGGWRRWKGRGAARVFSFSLLAHLSPHPPLSL